MDMRNIYIENELMIFLNSSFRYIPQFIHGDDTYTTKTYRGLARGLQCHNHQKMYI